MRAALRWLCYAILGSVTLVFFVGMFAQHGWTLVVFLVVVTSALIGAAKL